MRELTEAAASAVAREVAALRREAERERELRDAQFAAKMSELTTAIASVTEAERRLADRLATLKDGRDGADGASVTADDVLPALLARADMAVAENVERVLAGWDRPKDGASVTVADVEPLLRDMVAALPPARDGKDGADGRSVTVDDVMPAIETRLVELVSAIPVPKDGKDGLPGRDADPAEVRAMIAEEIAPHIEDLRSAADAARAIEQPALPDIPALVAEAVRAIPAPRDGRDGADGKDGASVTIEDVAPMIEHSISEAVAAIPAPKDGRDGEPGKDGERGPEGPAGKLPTVKEWADGVHYEGEAVTRNGSIYQALRDTGKEPPHGDWRCIVGRGRDGTDGKSFTIRGTYAPDADYAVLDVVSLNGGAFAAKHDDPGPCPGEGWQLIASQGKRGDRGGPGDRGPAGPSVVALDINGEGLLTARNADGSAVECDLYPVLSRLG